MKKSIINIFWGVIVFIVLSVILGTISSMICTMVMPNIESYEALGSRLAIPIFIVSILLTIKILKIGILPGTKKKE